MHIDRSPSKRVNLNDNIEVVGIWVLVQLIHMLGHNSYVGTDAMEAT